MMIEQEQFIIGAILKNNGYFTNFADKLNSNLFTDQKCRELFDAVSSILSTNGNADEITIFSFLQTHRSDITMVDIIDLETKSFGEETFFRQHLDSLILDSKKRELEARLLRAQQMLSDPLVDITEVMSVVSDMEIEEPLEDDYTIDLSVDYPQPNYTLSVDGIGTIPRGDIQAIKAKSKNGKSFLCSILASSLLGCTKFGIESKETNPKILYFDTEQNKRNSALLAKRVHILCKIDANHNDNRFRCFSLRRMAAIERLGFIRRKIKNEQPTLVFIDGIADLISDFNDISMSTTLISDLMRLSADNDCAICCVLHTNKGKDDNGMKGHLGTMLLQKASDVFEVQKNGAIFNVSESDCRNMPIDDFSFCLDNDGIPQTALLLQSDRNIAKIEESKNALRKVFSKGEEFSYTEIWNIYQQEAACSERTAKSKIAFAKENDLILSNDNGKYIFNTAK